MKRSIIFLCLGLMVASCGKDSEAPTGQVVATVDGHEVTTSDLEFELHNVPSDPAAAAAAKQAALQNLIARKLLVAAAKERELDSTPIAAMAKQRAEEMTLVQLLQSDLAKNVPPVSDSEVASFITQHPTTFAQRRLISVDQLLVPQIDRSLVKQMEPLNTLSAIEALLDENGVKFIRAANVLDSLKVNPEIASKVAQLNEGDVFIAPAGKGVQVAQIVSSRVEPLTGDEAQQVARQMVTRQRNATQVRNAMNQIIKQGQDEVKINPEYAPKKQKAKPSPSPAPKS